MKKSVALLVALVIAVTMIFSGCKTQENVGGVLKLANGDVKVNSFVKINGEEISYDLFRYCYLTEKKEMEEANSSIDWSKKENADKLLEEALGQVKFFSTIEALIEKYDYELTSDIYADVEDTMKKVYDACKSAEEYRKILAENYLNPEIYEDILILNALYAEMEANLVGTDKKVNKITFTEQEALDYYNKNYARLASVYFEVASTDEEGTEISDEQFEKNKAETKKLADAAYKKLETKSFEEVMREYLSEEEAEANLVSYYPIASISNGLGYDVGKLKVGEVTEVIYSQSNYFIIQRLENDNEYIKKYLMNSANTALAEEKFGKIVEETMDGLKVEKLEYFGKITPETLV